MKATIQRWGNSAAVRLPKAMLVSAEASVGDEVEIRAEAGEFRLRLVRPRYSLAELVAASRSPLPRASGWDELASIDSEWS